mgnify:CR=1 FL=1
MGNIEDIQNLNSLKRGIYKHWIWGNEKTFFRSCDCIQKANYSIQDLNAEICNLSTPTMKDVIYVIVLVDWICETVTSIHTMLRKEVLDYLNISKDEHIKNAEQYFKAIRSFVVAHPLNTNRHKKFGMDGDLICIDIRINESIRIEPFIHSDNWFYLSLDGLRENAKSDTSDFVLCVYSEKWIKTNLLNM